MEVIRSDEYKSRKEHRCNYCSGKIKKGVIYANAFIVDQGDSWTWKAHLHCMALTTMLGMDSWGDGITEELFEECVREDFDEHFSTAEKALMLFEHLKSEEEKPDESADN